MNPRYRFFIKIAGERRQAYPIYGDDLSKNYARESGQMFFRAKLDGKLKFVNSDYDFIMSSAFDETVYVDLEKYNTNTGTWDIYFKGLFTRTDCTIVPDDVMLEVSLTPNDAYEVVLSALEKEHNLIELAPEIKHVQLVKRPAIQVYAAGDTVLTSFVGGTYFEQDCQAIINENTLKNTYYFASCGYAREFIIGKDGSGTSTDSNVLGTYVAFMTSKVINYSTSLAQTYMKVGEPDIRLEVTSDSAGIAFKVVRVSTGAVIAANILPDSVYGGEKYIVFANSGQNSYEISYVQTAMFARVLTDTTTAAGTVYDVPYEDIAENNMNYKKVYPYATNAFVMSANYSKTPTEYGIIQPGTYFSKPVGYAGETLYPVSRSQWVNASIWYRSNLVYDTIDSPNRKEYTLKHAYTIESCLDVLLSASIGALDTRVYFTKNSSKFLSQRNNGYNDINPVSSLAFQVLITQKTNILKGEYDKPAQKAIISLKQVFDMLKNCFQCYWYLSEEDDGYELHIEHISFFQNAMGYPGWDTGASVEVDLTTILHPRTGKPWSFGSSEYTFEKEKMPAWYQFEWADDVTMPFKGNNIEVVSRYAKPDLIETVTVNNFSSDVDLMLLNPSAFSDDGFALLVATNANLLSSSPLAFTTSSSATANARNTFTLKTEIRSESAFVLQGTATIGSVAFAISFLDSADKVIGMTAYTEVVPSLGGNFTIKGTTPIGTAKIKIHAKTSANTSANSRGTLSFFSCDDIISLPIVSRTIGVDTFNMQNGYAAFCDLQERYYLRSMPASRVIINKTQRTVVPTKMKKQEIEFPAGNSDPNIYGLVKTSLGDGTIDDMKINLSTRLAKTTLLHDTEK